MGKHFPRWQTVRPSPVFGTARCREGGARAALRCSAFDLRLGWAVHSQSLILLWPCAVQLWTDPRGAVQQGWAGLGEQKQHDQNAKGLGSLNPYVRKSESAKAYRSIRPTTSRTLGRHRRQVAMGRLGQLLGCRTLTTCRSYSKETSTRVAAKALH